MDTRVPDSPSLNWTLRADVATIPYNLRLNFRKYLKTLQMLDQASLIFTNIAEEFPRRQFVITIIGKNMKVRISQVDDTVSIVDPFMLLPEDEKLLVNIVTSIVSSKYDGEGMFTLVDSAPYAVHVHLKDKWKMSVGPMDLINPDLGAIPDAIADMKTLIARGENEY